MLLKSLLYILLEQAILIVLSQCQSLHRIYRYMTRHLLATPYKALFHRFCQFIVINDIVPVMVSVQRCGGPTVHIPRQVLGQRIHHLSGDYFISKNKNKK